MPIVLNKNNLYESVLMIIALLENLHKFHLKLTAFTKTVPF